MLVKQLPVATLKEYGQNSRTHSTLQVGQIAESIKAFGWTNPLLVDEARVLIAGHGRLAAAKLLGLAEVPCIEIAGLSEDKRRALVIADNQLALNAGWDEAVLAQEVAWLQDQHFDTDLLGFDADFLDGLLAEESATEVGLTDQDDAPAVQANAISRLGDVWLLGKHRVMCGDSTSLDDVNKLMADALADMVFTDPPYNVAYEGRGEVNKLGPIKNDSMSDEQFETFCREFFTCYFAAMKPLACIYVCHPDSKTGPKLAFEKTFSEHFQKSSTLIWVKQSAGMGWQDYRAQHEPILYGWKNGSGKHFFCGDRTKTTVWNIGRDAQASYVHPTQKPVALPSEAIMNSTKGADVVLDLFGGSGSTLIACEKNGRYARVMELDPKYCDVIVRRWQAFTGKQATLGSSGATFEQVAADRKT